MGTSLAVIDKELTARKTIFAELLPPSVTADKLMRTVMMSVERNPRLAECSVQSIVNAATTAAVLGLECDGVTGQGYIVPYKTTATFQIGYKGYNTMAARAGYTITGSVVREGDEFDYELGSAPYIRHRPGNARGARIVMAWAAATSKDRPPIIRVMSIEEIEDVKARSQGARKADSPWNDPAVGYPAMCEKTVKRRLARDMPMSVMQAAAALDSAQDRGSPAHIDPRGQLHEAEGPQAKGTIIDVEPANILEPVKWPKHRTPKEFFKYSDDFLTTATAEQASAWHAHYADTLLKLKDHSHPSIQLALTDLLMAYGKATNPHTEDADRMGRSRLTLRRADHAGIAPSAGEVGPNYRDDDC
jgi:recombination protein RecT